MSWLRFKRWGLDFMSGEELTPEVLARREYHVRNALASFALEGEYPSKEIETIEELRKQIDLLEYGDEGKKWQP